MTIKTVTGSLTGVGPGEAASFTKSFNITLSGTFDATIALERSFDSGATWVPVSQDIYGTPATYNSAISIVAFEPENGIFYRLRCTAYNSGTINWRLSQ